MKKVALYSFLLIAGLVISQFIPAGAKLTREVIALATMVALAFIMIHVGYEFEIDKSQPRKYLWDYFVAFTAAAFPWIFCAMYFVFVMMPSSMWGHADSWKESLLQGRFASPTSAGVLFSMLAAAGLAATWVFKKARVLAIFDDLDTILLMIPLKIMLVGFKWQLAVIVLIISALLWVAWRYLHRVPLPVRWPFVLSYSIVIAVACHAIHVVSHKIDPAVPIHLEVLLPAFVLGCILRPPKGQVLHIDDAVEDHLTGPDHPRERRAATIISALFMILVGLSMPVITRGGPETPSVLAYAGVSPAVLQEKNAFPGWEMIGMHVLMITILSNIGKMFCAFCYRREATLRERMAVSVGMFPRGEVGAGVLVVSLSYGMGGPALTVAVLSLALNLLCTGLFILVVKKLLENHQPMTPPS